MPEKDTPKTTRRTFMQGTGTAGLFGITGPSSNDARQGQTPGDKTSDSKRRLPPDTVYRNGVIVTLDDTGYNSNPGRIVEAMATRNGRIVALGCEKEVLDASIRAQEEVTDTQIVDLQGKMVLPGLIESHTQQYKPAKTRAKELFNLSPVTPGYYLVTSVEETGEEVLAKAKEAVNQLREAVDVGEDQWIGIELTPDEEKGFPSVSAVSNLMDDDPDEVAITREDLDEVVSDRRFMLMSGWNFVEAARAKNIPEENMWFEAKAGPEGEAVLEEVTSFEGGE